MKQLICIFSLILLLLSCSVGSYTVATEINDEIDPKIRSNINKTSLSVMNAIRDQNYEDLIDYLSPNLLALEKFDIKSFADQFTAFLSNNTFLIKDQYYSRIIEGKEDSIVTVI
ncbi:MAG: hypothetical protein JW737_04040 [Acidobacteria bacterium]|nr:hypothetical protein [Acidobacteriota bacterium]